MKIPVYLSGRSAHEACRAEPKADYVPTGKTADLLYCRIGNPSPELTCQVLKHDAKVTCYFPVGAKAGAQMPHGTVDDLLANSEIEVVIAAPESSAGSVLIDMGFVEI